MITLLLPHPPSANHIWQSHRITERYRVWKNSAGWACKGKHKKIIGPWRISINAPRPDKRRRDLDNILKPIIDLVVEMNLVEDDSKLEMISARWTTSGEGVEVRLEQAAVE